MTQPTIRPLTEDQWPEWRVLRLAALAADPDAFGSTLADWSGPGDDESRWRERLSGVALNLVADLEGEAVGMASATLQVDGTAEVLSMWVAPSARGRGVGDALMVAALQWARENDAERVALDVRHGNRAAIALYVRHDFRDVGWASGPGDPHPERRMVLDLASL
jgi:ribosomal protein S18 acetylase RimI-like enzyme